MPISQCNGNCYPSLWKHGVSILHHDKNCYPSLGNMGFPCEPRGLYLPPGWKPWSWCRELGFPCHNMTEIAQVYGTRGFQVAARWRTTEVWRTWGFHVMMGWKPLPWSISETWDFHALSRHKSSKCRESEVSPPYHEDNRPSVRNLGFPCPITLETSTM